MTKVTLDMISYIAFGKSLESLIDPTSELPTGKKNKKIKNYIKKYQYNNNIKKNKKYY